MLFASCENGIGEVSETYAETPSEAVTTEELTVPEESSSVNEIEAITTEDFTTVEATTEEVTTEAITTEAVTTEEVTTEEVTTEEVTTAEITTEEITSAPEPHTHVWSSWKLSKNAGCIDKGEEKRNCICGESEIRYTEALGHIEGRLITVEKATCAASGYGHRICGRCTLILRIETIPALEHTPYTTVKKATCTEDGFEKITCKVCESELSFKEIKAFGHTEGRHIVLSKLTCTEDGVEDIICASCTMVLRTEITKAQGHRGERIITAQKATCTEKGLQHIICSVCTLILREETVDATGHTVGPWTTSAELSTDEISVRQRHCVSCDLLMDEERVKSLALVEAERVSGLINAIREKNSFTFAAMSDLHVDNVGTGYNQIPTKKSCEFAAKTLSILERSVDIGAAVMLGDFTASSSKYTAENVIKDFEFVRECFSNLGDYPVGWIRGNHEINYYKDSDRPMTNEELCEYIDSNNRGMIADPQNPTGGYGFIDFPEYKIRMIFLNTSDVYTEYTFTDGEDAPSLGMSSAQLKWLATTALDFSDKSDVSEWGIIINSHAPLDYIADTKRALMILEAYRAGMAGSIDYVLEGNYYSVEYNFRSSKRAEIICNIHGHIHNFKYEKISASSSVEPWLWRICVPNMCAGRENQYSKMSGRTGEKWSEFDANGDPVYYTKSHWDDELGTFVYDEEDATSFCIFTVNRDARTIYVHYVGTGIDRVIEY